MEEMKEQQQKLKKTKSNKDRGIPVNIVKRYGIDPINRPAVSPNVGFDMDIFLTSANQDEIEKMLEEMFYKCCAYKEMCVKLWNEHNWYKTQMEKRRPIVQSQSVHPPQKSSKNTTTSEKKKKTTQKERILSRHEKYTPHPEDVHLLSQSYDNIKSKIGLEGDSKILSRTLEIRSDKKTGSPIQINQNALIEAIKTDNFETLKNMINNKCNIDQPIFSPVFKRRCLPPIMWAIKLKKENMVRFLIREGCNINCFDEEKKNILHHCLENKLDSLVNDLLTWLPHFLELKDPNGNTPLHLAICVGEPFEEDEESSIKKLLNAGANVNEVNNNGDYPLHTACNRGLLKTVVYLLEKKAEVNSYDSQKNTPLHLAVEKQHLEIVRYLLSNGANPRLENRNKKTPRDMILNSPQTLKLLESYDPHCKYVKWGINSDDLIIHSQIKMVGEGQSSGVYKGSLYGSPVAVKILKPGKGYFEYEVGLLSEIRHPNILLFMGACVKREGNCIVTEYIDGGSLREHIEKNWPSIDTEKIISFGLDIARAMAWLHSGAADAPIILHRDLHSNNILVNSSATVCKVIDFGLSQILGGAHHVDSIYLRIRPPELDLKPRNYTTKSDVFMYGLILYELYFGKKADESFYKDLKRKLKTLEDAQLLVLLQIIVNCTSVDPNERPEFVRILKLLEEIQNITPINESSIATKTIGNYSDFKTLSSIPPENTIGSYVNYKTLSSMIENHNELSSVPTENTNERDWDESEEKSNESEEKSNESDESEIFPMQE